MSRRAAARSALAAALLLLALRAAPARGQGDEWDAVDAPVSAVPSQPSLADAVLPQDAPGDQAGAAQSQPRSRTLPLVLLGFLLGSLAVSLIGGRANAKRTLAFEEHFCGEGGLLRKHFERLGKGKGLLVADSPSTFKLHLGGHPQLEAAVITLTLLRRHELVSCLAQLLTKFEDVACLEFFVRPERMPPMVLAVAAPGIRKELLRNQPEVRQLASPVEVREERLRDWPREDLLVYAEHPSCFYDMMTRPMLSQVFGREAFQKHKALFRGFQVTSDDTSSSHRQVVRFWLVVPPAERMEELRTLLTAALAMVGQVAGYSLSPERQKAAEQAREGLAKKLGRKEPGASGQEAAESRKAGKKRK